MKEEQSLNNIPAIPKTKTHPGAFKAEAIHNRIIIVIIKLPPYSPKAVLFNVLSFVFV